MIAIQYHLDDTICAIASAPGGAARGIVRISGPAALDVARRVFHFRDATSLDAVRKTTATAGYAGLRLHERHTTVPCTAFIWPNDRSYTREPVVEFHTLGSPPVLKALVAKICDAGARPAEPGEFTLRAFLAGRMDLTQAEAVLGVIDARGKEELDVALSQLAGGLARPLHQLREDLLQLLAELEAGLDFVEEDIEFITCNEIISRLDLAGELLRDVRRQVASRSTATNVPQVALVGAPNAGKSSLFNAIVARFGVAEPIDRQSQPAIVSSQSGTTRDYLNATVEFKATRWQLVDTAGMDALQNEIGVGLDEERATIEQSAQSLARERHMTAAVRVHCIDSSVDAERLTTKRVASSGDIIVLTKADLITGASSRFIEQDAALRTSSRTGFGIDALCAEIRNRLVSDAVSEQHGIVGVTADRCRESIRRAEDAIGSARQIGASNGGNELVAAEIRGALAALGTVVGTVYTDDLLDRIFGKFCIGK